MEPNEGAIDRVLRLLVGGVVLYLMYTWLEGALAIAGLVFGVILVFTAVTGYCHFYKILGISTKK